MNQSFEAIVLLSLLAIFCGSGAIVNWCARRYPLACCWGVMLGVYIFAMTVVHK